MARDGLRIFDADTHVGPTMAVLERYLTAAERAALEPLSDKRATRKNGQVTYQGGERKYEGRGAAQGHDADVLLVREAHQACARIGNSG